MSNTITILTGIGTTRERYPIHPRAELCASVAAALNSAAPLPRENIRVGHYKEDNGHSGCPLRAAWLVVGGTMFLLAVKPWEHRYSATGEADRPWVPARSKEVSHVAA